MCGSYSIWATCTDSDMEHMLFAFYDGLGGLLLWRQVFSLNLIVANLMFQVVDQQTFLPSTIQL